MISARQSITAAVDAFVSAFHDGDRPPGSPARHACKRKMLISVLNLNDQLRSCCLGLEWMPFRTARATLVLQRRFRSPLQNRRSSASCYFSLRLRRPLSPRAEASRQLAQSSKGPKSTLVSSRLCACFLPAEASCHVVSGADAYRL